MRNLSKTFGKLTILLLLLLAISFSALPVQAKYGGGSGTPEDPYQIRDANHMQAIGADQNDWDKHFKLMADLDLSSFTGTSFNIIGTSIGKPFTGVFDGSGHAISNFTYTSNDKDNIGLFGNVGKRGGNAEIKNLGLIDPNVDAGTGDNVGSLVGRLSGSGGTVTGCYVEGGSVVGGLYVGGLVGRNYGYGTITNCYSSGDASGTRNVGGLVGENWWGTVINSYATGSASGTKGVGGLVGENWVGTVINSYATGSASGTTDVGGLVGENWLGAVINSYATGSASGTTDVGGLVGKQYYGLAYNSFWDIETSGQDVSAGGEGKTTAQMMTANTFVYWGACGEVWTINEGVDYPRLSWEQRPGGPIIGTVPLQGDGDSNSPYLVHTPEELNVIGLLPCVWDKHFKLMADIDLSAYTGTSFNIIGTSLGKPFTGVFDGSGHAISNFTYSSTDDAYLIGLFGIVSGVNAEIKNLGLIDPNVDAGTGDSVGSLVGVFYSGRSISHCYAKGGRVSGDFSVGGLAGGIGSLDVTVTDCYATCSVLGNEDVGGLVGFNNGSIYTCYSAGSVTGTTNVGGLAGENIAGVAGSAEIWNCYSAGSVSGINRVGGLVGYNLQSAGIVYCYSSGSVLGTAYVGGLVGWDDSGAYYSFWDIQTSGQTNSAGGTGKTTAEMQMQVTFTDAGWDFVNIWDICEGTNYPKLVWQIPSGDFLCPDGVNFFDFSFFAAQWAEDNCGASNDCDGRDLDLLGSVDIRDLRIFADNWLAGF